MVQGGSVEREGNIELNLSGFVHLKRARNEKDPGWSSSVSVAAGNPTGLSKQKNRPAGGSPAEWGGGGSQF